MGMVVRTNMAALNANNALTNASKAQQTGMQKLASGFRINKAADDASGLAISEKMKNQIKALDTAKDNCEDGANMIQTAEGYMAETHSILERMTELAEKAANGVLQEEDRDALQDEMNQLSAEIDRIATSANFNGHKLMDGTIGGTGELKLTCDKDKSVIQVSTTPDATASNSGIMLQIGESSTSADRLEVKINSFHTNTLFSGLSGFSNITIDDDNQKVSAKVVTLKNTDVSMYNSAVSIDITDKDNASAAADAIRMVSSYVSDERGKLGALQNRLDHTVNTLTTASENTSAANSRIRDTDMAKEMMNYTSKNIIAQAAQSMLAQANTQPQNVLSLLQ